MTCTPYRHPATALWEPYMALFEQQMRLWQMMSEAMLQANPWIAMAQASGVNPLTRDAALGTGDAPDDINLESGVAASSAAAPNLTPKPPAKPQPKPRAKPAARKTPATPRSATGPRKSATKPTAATNVTASAPTRSRRRRQPASPPPMPGNDAGKPDQ